MVSIGIAALGGLMGYLPIVLLVTLVIAGFGGMPAFALLRRRDPPWAPAVLGSGFAIGVAIPAVAIFAQPVAGLRSVISFGVAGGVGAALTWGLAQWLTPGDARHAFWRRVATVAATVGASIGSMAVPNLYADRSCHNPLRDGRPSIGPVASFSLLLPRRDWPELDRTLHHFAQEHGWSAQVDHQPATGDMPWFQQSLCTESGTQIMVMNNAADPISLDVSAFQPQGGNSWRKPLHQLQRRLEARWSGRTSYRYDAYASPRPPWAPPSPTPAPSSAAR